MSDIENFTPQPTADGSFTFFSKEFNELFHSHHGARQESLLKFVDSTQLAKVANQPILRILDVCYGLGYNTAAALQTIWTVNPSCCVEVIGLEINPAVPQAAIKHNLFNSWATECTEILTELANKHRVYTQRCTAKLIIGDARKSIQLVNQSNFRCHAIFLDPFSPPQCPQLWTIEFIKQLSLALHKGGVLATYSCAAAVRTALLAAGLEIGSTAPVGRRSPGTVAAHAKAVGDKFSPCVHLLSHSLALCPQEKEHLLTRAAIPYRDPQLCDSADVILKRRQLEQEASCLEPTSRWRKRWLK